MYIYKYIYIYIYICIYIEREGTLMINNFGEDTNRKEKVRHVNKTCKRNSTVTFVVTYYRLQFLSYYLLLSTLTIYHYLIDSSF
jgi:hypothetical protein